MKARRLKRAALREFHHHVYVVLLSSEVMKRPSVLRENPNAAQGANYPQAGLQGKLRNPAEDNRGREWRASAVVRTLRSD
jgi:hypothetical protein